MDRDINRAIENGENNRRTAELIRNWCAHVRIEKFGGVGLVEIETGLPIGPHGLACDYAPMGGMASSNMRDAAIDFHDRNCAACSHRQSVKIPNLGVLVAERDRQRQASERQRAQAILVAAEARARRKSLRDALRPTLGAPSCGILDDLEHLDQEFTDEVSQRLHQAAKMAPEHFADPIVEHLFDCALLEGWYPSLCLEVLSHISSDEARLAKAACRLVNLAPHEAASVLENRLTHLSSEETRAVVRTAIELAAPDHRFTLGERKPSTGLLIALWKTAKDVVCVEIRVLLASRVASDVRLAARGLDALIQSDRRAATPFARDMATKLTRARLLVDDLDRHNDLQPLGRVLGRAFIEAPEIVGAILEGLLAEPVPETRQAVLSLFGDTIRLSYSDDFKQDGQATTIALRHLLQAATSDPSQEVLNAAAKGFGVSPGYLPAVAISLFEYISGALLLLDDRLREARASARQGEATTWIAELERGNRISWLISLMEELVEWAAFAAHNDSGRRSKYVALLESLPADRDELRGIMLQSAKPLAQSVAGLNAILPHLYSGIVGSSQLVRAYAARVIGKLPHRAREQVPPLLHEAFVCLLSDPYVIVHTAAVDALSRFSLPDDLVPRVFVPLLNLAEVYSKDRSSDRLLLEVVEQLANHLRRTGPIPDKAAALLIGYLRKAEPTDALRKVRWLAHSLGHHRDFAELVAHLFRSEDLSDHQLEDLEALIRELPTSTVAARAETLADAAQALYAHHAYICFTLVEALWRAGAWRQAESVASACIATMPDTPRNAYRRSAFRSLQIAATFERSIAHQDMDSLPGLAAAWSANQATKRKLDEDAKTRRSRGRFHFPD